MHFGVKTAIAALALAAWSMGATAAPVVKTTSGPLAGSEKDGIQRFFGIPYAAAPVGDLRWAPPQAVKPWRAVRQASAFGPVCRQTAAWVKEPQSEDCLFLNVWAPANKPTAKPAATSGTKTGYPVMVWIHGGGFSSGSGSQWGADGGNQIVKKDVILVTINYRLGAFGFFAHPELTAASPVKASGNQGLLDQIAALKWVRDNIAAFGGDPSRVTIVGESAGGGAVSLLTLSPLAKGLFQRAIIESGAVGGAAPAADVEKRGVDFAKALGESHIAALRQKSSDALLAQNWGPQPQIDGYVLTDNPKEAYAAGRWNHVPVMLGWNADEGPDLAPEMFGTKSFTAQNVPQFMSAVLGGPVPAPVLQAYPASNDAEATQSLYRFVTDTTGFVHFRWAYQQAATKSEPAYLYNFLHWPAEPAEPCAYGCKAGHTAEIRFAFGLLNQEPRAWTAGDRLIETQMVGYWTNFAKTGNPNGEGLPQWAAFDGTPDSTLRIGTPEEIKARGAIPDFRPYLALFP